MGYDAFVRSSDPHIPTRKVSSMIAEQYYVFTGPDGWAWCEMFFTDDQGVPQHCTLPTPYREVRRAIDALTDQHPHAVVDQLQADDIADAMRYAGAIA